MRRRLLVIAILFIIGGFAPFGVRAATLYFSPSSGTHTIGADFSVSVGVSSATVAINAAQATISYPANLLEVRSISEVGIFTIWPLHPNSSTSGTIRFQGGLTTPGYKGSAGTIMTVTFRGKAEGTATVTIGSAMVLTNSDPPVNSLTSSGRGSYTITAPAPPPPEKPLPAAPTISSSTHADQNTWYANNAPAFGWTQQAGVTGFSFSFDDQATGSPDTIGDGSANRSSYIGTNDGVWYFHVRAQNENGWGPSGHFRVQIDTTPPLPFSIDLVDGVRTDKSAPRMRFATTDATSGVQHYDVIVDGGTTMSLYANIAMPYRLPTLSVGDHTVAVVAYDYAGNSTRAIASFTVIISTVTPPGGEETKEPAGELPPILKKIEKIIPKPVQKVIININRTVNQWQKNETVIQMIDTVVAPVVTATAIAAAAGIAASASGLELFNALYLFFRFGYFWLLPIIFGKRRKPWGVVFDSTTGRPVRRAIVRIFSKEFNKLKESQITDADGRFGFLVNAGEYFITVTLPGYIFPSRLLKTATISLYENIYHGGLFTVKERIEQAVSVNIPVDPEIKVVAPRRLVWLRILNIIGLVLEKLNIPLLIGGTVLSWVTLIFQPNILNYAILGLYAVLLLAKMLFSRRLERSWGLVTDLTNGTPVEYAVVRVYNTNTGGITGTRVTNKLGQFTALVPPGYYFVMAARVGYLPFQSRPIHVSKRRGMIRLGIQLMPQQSTTSTAPGSIINLQPMDQGTGARPIVSAPAMPPPVKSSSPFAPPTPMAAPSLPKKPPLRKKKSGPTAS